MKIGILETGEIPENLLDKHGDYPSMFADMLRTENPGLEIFAVKVVGGEMPASPHDADGWIITGSRHGVYDDLPWIEPLKEFLRACINEDVPVAGICFGHQILAEALGGKVEKSDKGWGIGVHDYKVENLPLWMEDMGEGFSGHAVHQDQIVQQPPDSTVVASSDFCEYAALVYGDPENPKAISVQPHPEFSAHYVGDLIDVRLAPVLPEDRAKAARESLGKPVHNKEWGSWINRFLSIAAERAKP